MKGVQIIFLILIYAGLLGFATAQTDFGQFDPTDFAAPQVCGGCHVNNFEEWEGSMHAASNSDPFYQLAFSRASFETGGQVDTYCPRCHSPVSYVTGQDSRLPEMLDFGNISENGVHCDFCHTIKSKTGMGNGLYVSSPGGTKYGPWDDADSPYHDTNYSQLHTTSDFCSICHSQTHFSNEVVIQSTFQEWSDSPYFEKGMQCQDCHMTPGPGFTQNPGRSTPVGKQREHIYTHNTAGSNIFQTKLHSPKHRALAVEMLKAAASLKVKTDLMDDDVFLVITISNIGAGHSIPTGSNALRQMWLEVKATDGQGNVIYSSGELDSAGNIDSNAVIYSSVYRDELGEITLNEWQAASIVSDNRIAAGESAVENHTFKIPRGTSGPVTISTKLLYRTAPQTLIDELFKNAAENVPIVEMAKEDINIKEPVQGVPGFGLINSIIMIGILNWMLRKRD